MGRKKLKIQRLKNLANRKATYSKRLKGLIKKAHDLSVLCNIDIALLSFSPSDRLSIFSGKSSFEDIFMRYINLPDHKREKALVYPDHRRPDLVNKEGLQQNVNKLQQELHMVEERLRKFEPARFTTMKEFETCEKQLLDTLTRVTQRREHLLSKQQNMSGPYVNDVGGVWLGENGPNQAHLFNTSAYSALLQGSSSNSNQELHGWMPRGRSNTPSTAQNLSTMFPPMQQFQHGLLNSIMKEFLSSYYEASTAIQQQNMGGSNVNDVVGGIGPNQALLQGSSSNSNQDMGDIHVSDTGETQADNKGFNYDITNYDASTQ